MNLETIESRVQAACDLAGRSRSAVTLIGASKRQPLERLRAAHDAGLRCFGENRVQEAEGKAPELPSDIDWHLIGPLQSNKAARAVDLFSTVHSVDRLKIVSRLDRYAGAAGRPIDCFLQINLGREPTKHGFDPEELPKDQLAATMAQCEHLRWRGLMAIPPPAESPEKAREWFAALRRLSRLLQAELPLGSDLSMGMSGDFEAAIAEGATHIRIGSSLFGERPA